MSFSPPSAPIFRIIISSRPGGSHAGRASPPGGGGRVRRRRRWRRVPPWSRARAARPSRPWRKRQRSGASPLWLRRHDTADGHRGYAGRSRERRRHRYGFIAPRYSGRPDLGGGGGGGGGGTADSVMRAPGRRTSSTPNDGWMRNASTGCPLRFQAVGQARQSSHDKEK